MQPSCFAALAFCATVASANITLIDENRFFEVSAQGESDFGGDQITFFDFGSSSNDDPFEPWNVGDAVFTNGAQSALASASGQFLMDIDDNGFHSAGSLSVSATILDETGYNAAANAYAQMIITFSIDTESLWRLTAEGSGDMLLTLENAGRSFFFFHTAGGIDEEYLLGPGMYTLTFTSSASVNTFGVGTFGDESSLNASFAIVPSPGGLFLAALSIPFTPRRRRQA